MHMYLHACMLTTSVQVPTEARVYLCPLELELQVVLHCLVLEGHYASLIAKLSLQPCGTHLSTLTTRSSHHAPVHCGF